jgi:hypothetical protein
MHFAFSLFTFRRHGCWIGLFTNIISCPWRKGNDFVCKYSSCTRNFVGFWSSAVQLVQQKHQIPRWKLYLPTRYYHARSAQPDVRKWYALSSIKLANPGPLPSSLLLFSPFSQCSWPRPSKRTRLIRRLFLMGYDESFPEYVPKRLSIWHRNRRSWRTKYVLNLNTQRQTLFTFCWVLAVITRNQSYMLSSKLH